MAKYEVISRFKDKEDKQKLYDPKDPKKNFYPRPTNKKVSDERIKELSGKNNNAKKPLIKKAEKEDKETDKE